MLQKNPSYYNNTTTKAKPKAKSPVVKTEPKKVIPPPIAKTQPKQTTPPPVTKVETKKITEEPPAVKAEPEKKINSDIVTNNLPKPEIIEKKSPAPKYEKRNSDLIKTIEIDNASFTVKLYDNGEIDGDSISLFFNGKLLLSHKRLSNKPIELKLDVDSDMVINELIMYAENLGTIPPNTALMVVNDGDNRYEVRISSDLQKSGVIRFIHKPKK